MFDKYYGTRINGQLHLVCKLIDITGDNDGPLYKYYIDGLLVDQRVTSSDKFELAHEDFLLKVNLKAKILFLEHVNGKTFKLNPLSKSAVEQDFIKRGIVNMDITPPKEVVEMQKFKIKDLMPAAIATGITALLYLLLGNSSYAALRYASGIALVIGPFMAFGVLENKFLLFKVLGSYSLIAAAVIAFFIAETIHPSVTASSSASNAPVNLTETYKQLNSPNTATRNVVISNIEYQNPLKHPDGTQEAGHYKQMYTFDLYGTNYKGFHKSEQPDYFLGDTISIYYLESSPAINQSTKNVNAGEFLR